MTWVDGYERAWRDGDLQAVEHLFTSEAGYRASPYEESEVGHAAIKAFWLEDEGETFTVEATPVAVEEATAVVRVLVRYGEPVRQEYLDLWVMHFTDDGRVDDFEEWPYWRASRSPSAPIDPRPVDSPPSMVISSSAIKRLQAPPPRHPSPTDGRSRVVLPGHRNQRFLLQEDEDGSLLLQPARFITEAQADYDSDPYVQALLSRAAASKTVRRPRAPREA